MRAAAILRRTAGRLPARPAAPRATAAQRGAARAASTQSAPNVLALASNLQSAQDVEDLAISYGVKNAAVPDVVRPLVVVKVGGEVITKEPENLVASLRFLYNFGLQPVVIHGGGPQLNDELAKAGVQPEYIGGHRVTDPATMKVAKRVFEAANAELAAALRKGGLEPGQLLGGIFRAEVADGSKLGLVGEIRSVEAGPVNDVIASGKIPVLTSLGLSASGQVLNINADVAARELAVALKPMKIVYISAGGGWKEDGAVISEINMAQDYDRMVNRDYTGRQGTLLKLKEMKQICDKLPPSSSVTIASATALASCLLPHRGPGTQIRRGQRINVFNSAGSTDALKLTQLLKAVGAEGVLPLVTSVSGVSPVAGQGTIAAVVATDDYSGAAVVATVPGCPVPVLQALALTPLAYAEGTEAALWTELRARFPALAWRATETGTIASAVKAVSEGGPSAIPRAFPPLSVARSATQATGSHKLPAGGAVMWAGAAASDVPAIVAAVGGAAAVPKPVVAPSHASAAGSRPLRLGLLGARGYVGRELVRLLAGHPSLQVTVASSRALVGQDVLAALGVPDAAAAVTPGLIMSDIGPAEIRAGKAPEVDVWVLALPNGLCAEHAAAVDAHAAATGARAPLLVDLSADQRFDTSGSWVYGLPERPGARERIRAARRISNPGCYATGSQAALLPLLAQHGAGPLAWNLAAKPHIFGVSGYSGAGTTPSDKNDPNKLRDNLLAYSLMGHIHEREIGWHCGTTVAFMPHVAPFFQGISLTVTGHLNPGAAVTPAAIRERFASFYAGEKLVTVLPGEKDMPDVRSHGSLHHGVTVGGFTYDAKSGRLALVSVIDNLLKGAATQALQNINLATGCGEYDGIPVDKA